MKLRVKYQSRLVPRGYYGWVIYPYMIFRAHQIDVSDKLFRHEMEHIYQVQREGWWKFYAKYLYYSLRYGYVNNPYEVEARMMENEPLTTIERFWKDGRHTS